MKVPSAGRVAAAAAVVAFIAIGAWRMLAEDDRAGMSARRDVATPTPRFISPHATMGVGRTAAAAPTPIAALPPARHASDAEVCGYGVLDLDQPASQAVLAHSAERAEALFTKAVQVLSASPDDRRRAVGLFLLRGVDAEAAAARVKLSRPPCIDDPVCEASLDADATAAARAAWQPATYALARLASVSSDPMVYAIASQACQSSPPLESAAVACQLISADQWSRLDPDNGAVWLRVAQAAADRKDGAAQAEALQRFANARTSRFDVDRMPQMVLAALPPATPAIERLMVNFHLVGIHAAMALPAYQTASAFCSTTALKDANRQQLCDRIADAMFSTDTTLIGVAIGRRIGERAGWPAEKQARAQIQVDAYMAARTLETPTGEELSCSSAHWFERYLSQLAEGGEVGVVRSALHNSGKTMAELAAPMRATREQAMARSAAVGGDAASSASQASPANGAASNAGS